MRQQESFSWRKRLKSFSYAFNGLKILLKEEHNARIHLTIAILVVIVGFVLKISLLEWMGILLSMAFVFSLELINSSIENLADFVSPEKQELIKKAKDLAAAAVLIAAFFSVIVGLLIFGPKIICLI